MVMFSSSAPIATLCSRWGILKAGLELEAGKLVVWHLARNKFATQGSKDKYLLISCSGYLETLQPVIGPVA